MNLMELGALGELVGGIAVIGSLVYLGLQVRQSNSLAVSRAHEEATRASSELAYRFTDPASVDLFVRANRDWSSLGPEEVLRLRALIQAGMNYFETLYYANERGEVHGEVWESRITRMRAYREIGFEHVWESLAPFYGVRFREFVAREVLPGPVGQDAYRAMLQAGVQDGHG